MTSLNSPPSPPLSPSLSLFLSLSLSLFSVDCDRLLRLHHLQPLPIHQDVTMKLPLKLPRSHPPSPDSVASSSSPHNRFSPSRPSCLSPSVLDTDNEHARHYDENFASPGGLQLCMPLPRRITRSRSKSISDSRSVNSSRSDHSNSPASPIKIQTVLQVKHQLPSSSPSPSSQSPPHAHHHLRSPIVPASPSSVASASFRLRSSSSSFRRNISPPLLRELEQAFSLFDANGDGKISAEELCKILQSLGDHTCTQEEALSMVAEVDLNGDGFVDMKEFIALNSKGIAATGEIVNDDELTAAFHVFDQDRNGVITAEELHVVLKNLGDLSSSLEDCARMIRGVDRKGLGHVDFDDFKLMMASA